jgi:hypothetical protein
MGSCIPTSCSSAETTLLRSSPHAYAIHAACEFLSQGNDVRRVIEPGGSFIERAELEQHYDGGRFPGLRIPPTSTSSSIRI